MGYLTRFKLLNEGQELDKIAEKIYEIIKNNNFFCYGIIGIGLTSSSTALIRSRLEYHYEQASWDGWDDDMKILSEALPSTVLHLQGIGEDNYDIWEAHFLDGKIQFCQAKVTISEFDPAELK
jgi:hypothetical protein